MLIAVRHGPTILDEPQAKGALQGWFSLEGLTEEGRLDAQNVTHTIRELPIANIFSSDIIRAIQTSEEIAGRFNIATTFLPTLRPWNVGDLAGKPFAEVSDTIYDALAHPKKKLPGGESAQNFLDRFLPTVMPLIMAKQVYLIITHSHNVEVLLSLAKTQGKTIDLNVMAVPSEIEAGGILLLNRDWSYFIINPPKELLRRPKRMKKSAVLYMHIEGSEYRCRECLLFIPDTKRCAVHGPDDEILPEDTCGLFVQGKPLPGLRPMSCVNKVESGYTATKKGSSCGNCEYYLPTRRDCTRVDPESPGDDPGFISPSACCNSFDDGLTTT
jgi:2,3-bisphosphoglycerate-dependent phosphoglycerate mutase